MTEETKTPTGGAAEFSQDRLANQDDPTEIPAIPSEIVGETTDIVSRDWTGVGGDGVDIDAEEEGKEGEEAGENN